VIVATGSEVALAISAAEQLESEGIVAQVVSLPSWDRLAAQDKAYRATLFPDGVPVLSVEAATTFGWERFADDSIGIDRFGASAPGDIVLDRLGINVGHVVARAKALVSR
jgi:transketolase